VFLLALLLLVLVVVLLPVGSCCPAGLLPGDV
jgi:hypothetical protein